MKKILLLGAFMVALVGCGQTGDTSTGGYGETETGVESDTTITSPSTTPQADMPTIDTNQVITPTPPANDASGAPGTADQGQDQQPLPADTNEVQQPQPDTGAQQPQPDAGAQPQNP